ncbi:hypothetical protein PSPO01_11315 [Paraphaeosphaeria sporulosa]
MLSENPLEPIGHACAAEAEPVAVYISGKHQPIVFSAIPRTAIANGPSRRRWPRSDARSLRVARFGGEQHDGNREWYSHGFGPAGGLVHLEANRFTAALHFRQHIDSQICGLHTYSFARLQRDHPAVPIAEARQYRNPKGTMRHFRDMDTEEPRPRRRYPANKDLGRLRAVYTQHPADVVERETWEGLLLGHWEGTEKHSI